MQRIVPNLWFDHTAAEAAEFYAATFPDARVVATQHYPTDDLPDFQKEYAGQVLTVEFEIRGFRMIGINAGPEFPITPAISFMVNVDPAERELLDGLWDALADGGTVLMPLDAYDFSPRYGWVSDRYGVSWQLSLTDPDAGAAPFVMPCLLFGGAAQNRAAEAIDYYTSVFPDVHVGTMVHYPAATGPVDTDSVMYADIELLGQNLALMDSGVEQPTTFTNGVSLMAECRDQAELDRYWAALSAVPDAEQCGWCVDRFGVSWQVVPDNLDALMAKPGGYAKLLAMKKIEVAAFG